VAEPPGLTTGDPLKSTSAAVFLSKKLKERDPAVVIEESQALYSRLGAV